MWRWLLILLLSAAACAAPLDLLSGKPILVQPGGYRLGMPSEELGNPDESGLIRQPDGIALRVRGGRVVNLISAAQHEITLDGQHVAKNGDSAEDLKKRLGEPRHRFTKPQFINTEMWYYPGAMADFGLLVQEGKLASFLLTEPGVLEATLMVAGYQKLP